jgi:hypothetical protein
MKRGLAHLLQHHWDALLASVAAALFIFCFTRHSGIGISPDSVMYQTTAENIRAHFSFNDFNNLPLVDFPVGYPGFLALIAFLSGSSVLAVAPVVNALLFAGVIMLTSYIVDGFRTTSRWYKLLFLSLLACSPALLEVYSMLWSETLFIFWVLLFIVLLRSWLQYHRMRTVWAMTLVSALAMVTRYAGITLVATAVFILLFDGELNLKTRIRALAVFIPGSLFLFALNLVRNHLVAGSLTGVREKALRSFADNYQGMAAAIGEWIPFVHGHVTASVIVLTFVLLLALAAVVYRLLQQQFYSGYELPVNTFLLVYLAFMLFISSVSRFEELSSRLLSPIYILFFLVASSWMINFIRARLMPWRAIMLILALTLVGSFHVYHYQLNAEAWEGIKDAGMPGYAEDSWTQSPTITTVRSMRNSLAGPVYSNANDAVYYLTGIHAMPLPHKDIVTELNALQGLQQFYLVWLVNGENADLVSLEYLKQHSKVELLRTFEDGALYRCTPK